VAAEAGHRDERSGAAPRQQVVDVTRPRRRVRGDDDGADLGEGELQHHPFGEVRRPDDHALSRFNADRQQTPSNRARFSLERPEGVARSVDIQQCRGVGQIGRETSQKVPDRHVTVWRMAHGRV
jgi:hypothetical protein